MTEENAMEKIENHIISHSLSFTITNIGEDYITPALSAISVMQKQKNDMTRVIIVGAKKNIENNWLVQMRRNSSSLMLSYTAALGKINRKKSAFFSGRKLIFTNDEALSWIEEMPIYKDDILVIDELSRYRNCKTDRYCIVKNMARRVSRIIAFSCFPIPHGLNEIWEEIYLLDGGAHLGRSKEAFLDRYFFINGIWIDGRMKIYRAPKQNAIRSISKAIKDICLDLSNYGNLSDASVKKRNVYIELSRSEMSRYILLSREKMFGFDCDNTTASDISMATGKLLQLASGTVYDKDKEVISFHNRKIEALKRLLKEYEGSNILVAYWFKHELEHIMNEIPKARPIASMEDIEDWNSGIISMGLINSSMGGHYGDLNKGGNILVWFSLTWSLSLYERTNSRIECNDVRDSLIVHLITLNTIDEVVMKILETHKKDNSLLLAAIRSNA